jgi:hypothetical protein
MRRAILLAAALALPISGASVALASGGQAWAGAKITCTAITGTATGTVTLSGCTGGNTGGASNPVPTSTLATGGTIPWVSGSSTTFGAPTLTATSAKKCPGYVKGGSNNPSAEKFKGAVTGDSGDGLKIPGKYQGAVCIDSAGNITALKPTTAT